MEQNENPPEKRYHKFSADLTQSCTDLADIALTRQRSASMQEPDNLNLSDITSQISNISDNNLSLLRPTLQLRPQDLTFEKFYRTDVSQLFLSVLGHETKLFSHVVNCLSEITYISLNNLELQDSVHCGQLSSFLYIQTLQRVQSIT